jgi:hypothetical protein
MNTRPTLRGRADAGVRRRRVPRQGPVPPRAAGRDGERASDRRRRGVLPRSRAHLHPPVRNLRRRHRPDIGKFTSHRSPTSN